ncbi:MAG TPA: AI-2E family transporter [Myxococcales bacterium]|jgi:predicted PurR-regulated permease PerM
MPPEARPRSQVTVKTVATVVLTVLGVVAVVYILLHAGFALTVTVAALLISIALDRPVRWLRAHKVHKGPAIGLVMVALVLGFSAIAVAIIPPAVQQGESFVQQVPQLVENVRGSEVYRRLDRRFALDLKLDQLQEKLPAFVQAGANAVVATLKGVITGVGAVTTVFFLIIFMLVFGPGLVTRALDEATPERRERYERLLTKAYRSIGGYLGGLTFICMVNAAVTSTFFAIIRVPFFLPLGILSGLSSFVPIIGNSVAGIVLTTVVAVVGGVWKGVGCAIFFVIYQQFENHILGPTVYRRTVRVNPLIVIITVMVLTEIVGLLGPLVAVPLVAIGQILTRELLALRRERLGLPQRVRSEA